MTLKGAPQKYHYTAEDVAIAESNNIKRKTFVQRLARGESVESARSRPIGRAHKYAPSLIEEAKNKGISKRMFYQRKNLGWSDEDAVNIPPRGKRQCIPYSVDDPLSDTEVIEAVGRIKYLNKKELKEYPIIIPETMRRRIEQMGMRVDDVEEVRV